MDSQRNILVVNNNASTQQLMEQVLCEYTLTFTDNASDALIILNKHSHDLIIAAIGKSDLDGYAIVEQIKAADNNQNIPVLYLSCAECDLINKGINYCKVESIAEPHGDKMFTSMVKHSIKHYQKRQEQKNEIAEVTDAMLSLQTDNAKLYDISRFLQHSFFCKDIHALCEQLFIVTRAFNISCTVYVHSEKNTFFLSDGITHGEQINNDILNLVKNEARIFQFGKNRAVFNWSCASLLVNTLGSDVDNLAMLMDGFEMGFKAIESVDDFNRVLEKYRKQNYQLKIQVARVVEDVASNITDELGQLGATAMLTVKQEDALVALAEQGRKEVDTLFNEGLQLDDELSDIMIKMRTKTETLSTTDGSDEGGDDSIDFF
ncbi:MAG: hypothetical protein QM504_02595 [Pseudomonadota bacterium]